MHREILLWHGNSERGYLKVLPSEESKKNFLTQNLCDTSGLFSLLLLSLLLLIPIIGGKG